MQILLYLSVFLCNIPCWVVRILDTKFTQQVYWLFLNWMRCGIYIPLYLCISLVNNRFFFLLTVAPLSVLMGFTMSNFMRFQFLRMCECE